MKAEALKDQTIASRPIKALMMYPPNTPATLVPRVLPTKSKVKINIFTLIQLFLEFEKTCKKRITPTGLTEGEKGFEQTRECYLIENVVHRKHAEIERKNLLIANDNLIVDCLSKDVFYITTNFELTVSRFTKIHDAHPVVQSRCLKLKAELSKLQDKIQTDDHNELVNRFSNLEVNHLNLQLKYQNLTESFGNNPPLPARETPDFDSVFVIGKMKASLQGKDNVIKKLKIQISQLKETCSEADRTLDFRTLDFQITQLTEKVTVLQEQNELFRAENEKATTGRTDRPLVFGFRLLKTYDGGSLTAQEFRKKFIVTVRFGNDHFGAIMSYGDYVIGDSVISRVYYVEGLGHNQFSVGQFYDSNLEVAFRKHSCYVRDTDGVELIKGSRGSNLYTISVEDIMKSSPIFLLSKASKNKSWLLALLFKPLELRTIYDLARNRT
ncbi:hypothetical protein Tco_0217498 [Tanacetum coccineum]